MTSEHLFAALGEIDEKYLAEIGHVRDERLKRRRLRRRISSIAAVAAGIVLLVPTALMLTRPAQASPPIRGGVSLRPDFFEKRSIYRIGETAHTPYGIIESLRMTETSLTFRVAKTDEREIFVYLWGERNGETVRVSDNFSVFVNGELSALPKEAGVYELTVDYSAFLLEYEQAEPYMVLAETAFYVGERALAYI